jgi:hypothetical protein
MAKPLSDIPDNPTEGAAGLSRDTLDTTHFLEHLEDLIGDTSLHWAFSTLSGIRDTIRQTGRITEGQRRAVANIRKHRGDDTQRRPTRRWEGFR